MTAPLKDNWQLAGLHALPGRRPLREVRRRGRQRAGRDPVRRVELRYENGGGLTGPGRPGRPPPPASPTDTWWLRLTKTGDTYTGADQRGRRDVGRHAGLGDDAVHGHARARPDGDRAAAERGPDRRHVRPHPRGRRGRERGAGDHLGDGDARLGRRAARGRARRRGDRRRRRRAGRTRGTSTATATEDADTATRRRTPTTEPGTYAAEVTVSDGEPATGDRHGDGRGGRRARAPAVRPPPTRRRARRRSTCSSRRPRPTPTGATR